jgi:hypothetical protein
MRKSHRILQENTGNRWNMEAAFRPGIVRIFPVDSCQLPVLSGKNRPKITGKKIRKIYGRNTASTKSPELPGTGRFQAGLFDLGYICECERAWGCKLQYPDPPKY